jgi:hypothetical protein
MKMMINFRSFCLTITLLALSFTGCATFRSDLSGAYQGATGKSSGSAPVSAVFIFTHVHQTLGYDAIPKIVGKTSMIRSFDDIFNDALRELGNLGKFSTFTEEASDVNRPERRQVRDSLITQSDYTIRIRIVEEKHFAPTFFAGFTSTISATLLPAPYRQSYRMETEVYTRGGKLVGTYHRQAYLTKWVELLLVFAYPFCPEDRKREEVMMALLHDTFRQMESEHVLLAL